MLSLRDVYDNTISQACTLNDIYVGSSREAKWGRIINITTDGAWCHAANVSYGASKFAIESYSRSAATELGPYGITVNVISPGAVQTGWMPSELERESHVIFSVKYSSMVAPDVCIV